VARSTGRLTIGFVLAISLPSSTAIYAQQHVGGVGARTPVEREVDPQTVLANVGLGRMAPRREVDPTTVLAGFAAERLLLPVRRADGQSNFSATGFETRGIPSLAAGSTKRASDEESKIDDSCAIDTSPPFDVTRAIAFYAFGDSGLACSRAVKEIESYRYTLGEPAYSQLGDAAYLNDPHALFARNMVERYVAGCSRSLDENLVSKVLADSAKLAIKKNIGVLDTPTGAQCIGTVVNERVFTARHCFVEKQVGNMLKISVPSTGVRLTLFDGARLALQPVLENEPDLNPATRTNDIIQLKISGDYKVPPEYQIQARPDATHRWMPLFFVSSSPYKAALNNKPAASPESLVLDVSPICSVLAIDEPFLFHACQTLAGMSGSPLLSSDQGQLIFLGVHSGDATQLPTACGKKLSAHYTNYGTLLSAITSIAK